MSAGADLASEEEKIFAQQCTHQGGADRSIGYQALDGSVDGGVGEKASGALAALSDARCET